MRKALFTLPLMLLMACNGNTKKTESVGETLNQDKTFKATNIQEQMIYQRAMETVIWGMPAVNWQLMYENLRKVGGDCNQIVYWSGLINSNNQTLTPNPDVIYINPFYDTRQGPVVLEIPAVDGVSSLVGSVDDCWQTAIEDIGPAGVDKGKGGKYLILPPGYKESIPQGYIPMPSSNYMGYAILRASLTSGDKQDVQQAIEYAKKIKIYPFAQAANPPQTIFVDLLNKPFGNVITYSTHYFEALNDFIQREPWLERDMAMVDILKTIGIEKGKAFNPDARTKEILSAAVTTAHQWIDEQYEAAFTPPFYDGTHWALPANTNTVKAISENYSDPANYPVDGRAVIYSMAYFSAKHLGAGQFYLVSIKDKAGNPFDGSKNYCLHLPANVPVKLYWSVTVYDSETHAVLQGSPYFSRASTTPGIRKNTDGSVDIYFGPDAPKGKESNWIPTKAGRGFELMARFYGPEKNFFDKVWKMGDAEKIN